MVEIAFAEQFFEKRVGMIRSARNFSAKIRASPSDRLGITYYTYSPSEGLRDESALLVGSKGSQFKSGFAEFNGLRLDK